MNFIKKYIILLIIMMLAVPRIFAAYILIPMDETQTNHLKAYGVAYWVLEREVEISWLLNYNGGCAENACRLHLDSHG